MAQQVSPSDLPDETLPEAILPEETRQGSRLTALKRFGSVALLCTTASLIIGIAVPVSSLPGAQHRVRLAALADGSGGPPAPTPTPTLLPPTPTPVTFQQRIAKLQYSLNAGATWNDLPKNEGAIMADEEQSIGLRAVKLKPNLPWPNAPMMPVWRNGSQVHWGESIAVQWTELTDLNTSHLITASCGNTLTAKFKVRPLYQIICYPDKRKGEASEAGDTSPQAMLIAEVKRFQGDAAEGLPVRFSAQYADGTPAGTLSGGDANGIVTTDGTGKASITLRGVTQAGKVRIMAVVLNPDGTELRRSRVWPLDFIIRPSHHGKHTPPH